MVLIDSVKFGNFCGIKLSIQREIILKLYDIICYILQTNNFNSFNEIDINFVHFVK